VDCVAREVARVYAELSRLPDGRFMRFAQARCGWSGGNANFMSIPMDVPASVPDAEVWKKLDEANSLAQFEPYVVKGSGALGLALYRTPTKAVLGLASAPELIRIDDARPVPDEQGTVLLRGTTKEPLNSLEVLINQGSHDSAPCELIAAGGRFQARCPMQADDKAAWIEFVAAREGVVLGSVVARAWAHRGELPNDYAMQPGGAAAPSAEQFSRILSQKINVARAQTSRQGLVLEKKQSATATSAVPYLFQASERGDSETLNSVSLGLLAGWDLNREIRGASLFMLEYSGRSPDSWLLEALESPLGRRTLLDGDDRALSLGVAFSHERRVRVVANAYRVFDTNHDADEAQFLASIDEQRQERGLGPLVRAEYVPELDRAAELVSSGETTPDSAIRQALERVATQAGGIMVHANYFDTYRVSDVHIDERLLNAPNLTVGLRITHYKPPGAAWSQLSVLVLLMTDRTA
jgi:hypothetical protein